MPIAPYIGSGLPAKVINTDGLVTLFDIAARELGDPLQWWRIATLNGLTDPWVPAMSDLAIPQKSTVNADGVPFG